MMKFNPPFFFGYIQPHGFFDSAPETHALWNYYIAARSAYERHVIDSMKLEGEVEKVVNFRQLFLSIARMYEVEPEAMAKCWDMVDMQCTSLDLPKLPDEERYRFNRPIVIH